MTDDQIIEIAQEVDTLIIKQLEEHNLDIIDLSAIICSRLRMKSIESDDESDFDALVDHLNSQTVVIPKTIH